MPFSSVKHSGQASCRSPRTCITKTNTFRHWQQGSHSQVRNQLIAVEIFHQCKAVPGQNQPTQFSNQIWLPVDSKYIHTSHTHSRWLQRICLGPLHVPGSLPCRILPLTYGFYAIDACTCLLKKHMRCCARQTLYVGTAARTQMRRGLLHKSLVY